MPRTTTLLKDETFTFRLDPRMKAEFAKSAAEQQKQPAQLLRDLVTEHLLRERRRAFEVEAQREVGIINGATANPANDEIGATEAAGPASARSGHRAPPPRAPPCL